jgi:hypothetical protein
MEFSAMEQPFDVLLSLLPTKSYQMGYYLFSIYDVLESCSDPDSAGFLHYLVKSGAS